MKKTFSYPELEVIRFKEKDVIRTSGETGCVGWDTSGCPPICSGSAECPTYGTCYADACYDTHICSGKGE